MAYAQMKGKATAVNVFSTRKLIQNPNSAAALRRARYFLGLKHPRKINPSVAKLNRWIRVMEPKLVAVKHRSRHRINDVVLEPNSFRV